MKITRSDCIEPCCDKAKENSDYLVVNYDENGKYIMIIDYEGNSVFDVNYCPFCGSKTEVEK